MYRKEMATKSLGAPSAHTSFQDIFFLLTAINPDFCLIYLFFLLSLYLPISASKQPTFDDLCSRSYIYVFENWAVLY